MIFAGMLMFHDPPKVAISETIDKLAALGIKLKIITGDNHLVAEAVAKAVGLKSILVLSGTELTQLSDDALRTRCASTNVFAEVEPNQKERIIRALKRAGNVVGYIGDGINDAPALHAADVGISVNNAVDVAKEAAQLVMLEHNLDVIVDAVAEGRRTIANTLKYIFMATSANFGNMFSMAGSCLFLPFLPLLPKQVLLTNLLTDLPELTIVTDSVDPELVASPGRWDLAFIRKFMLTFGTLSSVFDYATFFVLAAILHAQVEEFRTAWFVESVVSACVVVLIIRTRRVFIKSKPSRALLFSTGLVVLIACTLPQSMLAGMFGFKPLPLHFAFYLFCIIVVYVVSAEIVKSYFYRWLLKKSRKPKKLSSTWRNEHRFQARL